MLNWPFSKCRLRQRKISHQTEIETMLILSKSNWFYKTPPIPRPQFEAEPSASLGSDLSPASIHSRNSYLQFGEVPIVHITEKWRSWRFLLQFGREIRVFGAVRGSCCQQNHRAKRPTRLISKNGRLGPIPARKPQAWVSRVGADCVQIQSEGNVGETSVTHAQLPRGKHDLPRQSVVHGKDENWKRNQNVGSVRGKRLVSRARERNGEGRKVGGISNRISCRVGCCRPCTSNTGL